MKNSQFDITQPILERAIHTSFLQKDYETLSTLPAINNQEVVGLEILAIVKKALVALSQEQQKEALEVLKQTLDLPLVATPFAEQVFVLGSRLASLQNELLLQQYFERQASLYRQNFSLQKGVEVLTGLESYYGDSPILNLLIDAYKDIDGPEEQKQETNYDYLPSPTQMSYSNISRETPAQLPLDVFLYQPNRNKNELLSESQIEPLSVSIDKQDSALMLGFRLSAKEVSLVNTNLLKAIRFRFKDKPSQDFETEAILSQQLRGRLLNLNLALPTAWSQSQNSGDVIDRVEFWKSIEKLVFRLEE